MNKYTSKYGGFTKVNLIKVHDGDTIKVNIPSVHKLLGQAIGVRIYGINTLELRSADPIMKMDAFKSLLFLREFLKDKKIILRNIKRDKYFRILADVYADGENVAEVLLKEGYAKPYFGDNKQIQQEKQ
jgi:micrococcal nuclease